MADHFLEEIDDQIERLTYLRSKVADHIARRERPSGQPEPKD